MMASGHLDAGVLFWAEDFIGPSFRKEFSFEKRIKIYFPWFLKERIRKYQVYIFRGL